MKIRAPGLKNHLRRVSTNPSPPVNDDSVVDVDLIPRWIYPPRSRFSGCVFFGYKKTMTWRGSPGGIFKGGSKLNQSWFHPHPTLPKTNSGLRTLESMMGKEKLYTFLLGFFGLSSGAFAVELPGS